MKHSCVGTVVRSDEEDGLVVSTQFGLHHVNSKLELSVGTMVAITVTILCGASIEGVIEPVKGGYLHV